MIKIILALALIVSSLSHAGIIPVDSFDQSKLESLLRKIPSSLVNEELHTNFKRKIHEFPLTGNLGFKIKCHGDYFLNSIIPSNKQCQVEVLNFNSDTDEVLVGISDVSTVNELRSALSYGKETKSFYSTERVHGLSLEKKYRELFRYSFVCDDKKCNLTFAKIPSKE
jgi:hypothetical protein